MKTVLVTGANGFIGKNLLDVLRQCSDIAIHEFDVGVSDGVLEGALREADVVFHLAGINRPPRPEDYEAGNAGWTRELVERLERLGRRPAIVFASSIQAERDNPYGRSKKNAEQAIENYAQKSSAPAVIFRLPNVFGKWCRPNYNSVIATFCHNSTHGLELKIDDPARELQLVYIDDVVKAWLAVLEEQPLAPGCRFLAVSPVYTTTVSRLAELMRVFQDIRTDLILPDFSDPFVRCLYATYLSYFEAEALAYALEPKSDPRGRLAELLKSKSFGQIFVSRTKPGIVRGNHYHRTKFEKFFVIEGQALIRFRHAATGRTVEYRVSGDDFKVVDIPPGYAHSIENVGKTELIVLFWAGEMFDPALPDTYPCEVDAPGTGNWQTVLPACTKTMAGRE